MENIVLKVEDLHTAFSTDEGVVEAVNGISFTIEKGKTLGIVGESGSGKSVASLSILRLLEGTTANIYKGRILFKSEEFENPTNTTQGTPWKENPKPTAQGIPWTEATPEDSAEPLSLAKEQTPQEEANPDEGLVDLLSLTKEQMRKIRGNRIAMVFQEPMTSLNPTMTIGAQIAEPIMFHQNKNKRSAWRRAVEMLELVGMPEPEKRAKQYPFELSGGMRQRVMIAIALACKPELLIADEPTTALDVTIQAQILLLIKRLQKKLGTSIIMITHDLGVIAETCDNVAVMYCGKIVEYTDVYSLFTNPKHPYTKGLLDSMPSHEEDSEENLKVIDGSVPSPYDLPPGCMFAPRCPYAKEICDSALPELTEVDGRAVRCYIYQTNEWEGEEI